MKHVILIEDRVHRQKKHLGQKISELESFEILTNISGGKDFADLKNKLAEKKYTIFDGYSTIMLHRSAFDAEVRSGLIEYLKDSDKKLVFFSGGISGSQLNKLKKIELMLINVTEFYSENLLIFLRNKAENLLELAFGNNWKISILIDGINKLTLYEKQYTQRPWDTVEEDIKLSNTIIDKYFQELSKKASITKDEIQLVLGKMKADLNFLL